jgi:hypothetical protein
VEGNDQEKGSAGKGFAALAGLVSDVDSTVAQTARESHPSTTPPLTHDRTTSTSLVAAGDPSPEASPYQMPPAPTGGSSGGKWLLGIGAVIVFVWIAGQSGNKSPPSPVNSSNAESPAVVLPSPQQAEPVVVPVQTLSSLSQERPPVGSDIVLSTPQIRYCMAEDIRMTAAKDVISGYNHADVARFNEMVADYNSRCGAYRYRRGALESARAEVEHFRLELAADGISRFAAQSAPLVLTPPPTNVEPEAAPMLAAAPALPSGTSPPVLAPQVVQAPATRDRAVLEPERASIEATCSTDKYLNGPSAYSACVDRQLLALRNGVGRPDLSGLSGAERQSIEAACSTDKYVNGPAAYNACLGRQMTLLSQQGNRPDLSQLSLPERQSIEAACSTDKYVNGPAAYNTCLTRQLSSLSQQGSRPDLSQLSLPERQSIEAACSTDKYVNGPAAYNKCLSSQLRQLDRQGSRPDLSGLSNAARQSIESACSIDKYVNGPAAYNACLSGQLVQLRR